MKTKSEAATLFKNNKLQGFFVTLIRFNESESFGIYWILFFHLMILLHFRNNKFPVVPYFSSFTGLNPQ